MPHELLVLEHPQTLLDRPRVLTGHGRDAARPEDLADHRRRLQQLLVGERERVETRRDQSLQRRRVAAPRPRPARGRGACTARRREDSRRPARARPPESRAARSSCRGAPRRSAATSSSRSADEAKQQAVLRLAPQPGRLSSNSGRAVQTMSKGASLRPLEHVVDEVEQVVVGPVQVFEDEHERTRTRQAPRGNAATRRTPPTAGRATSRSFAREADERAKVALHPCRLGVVAKRFATAVASFSPAVVAGSASRIPACALTISPSAQKVTPAP